MMTVLNERDNMQKYTYLEFVEFLDMLCRICIVSITRTDTLDYLLHFFLEILYKRMYATGQLDKAEFPLQPVDETLR